MNITINDLTMILVTLRGFIMTRIVVRASTINIQGFVNIRFIIAITRGINTCLMFYAISFDALAMINTMDMICESTVKGQSV